MDVLDRLNPLKHLKALVAVVRLAAAMMHSDADPPIKVNLNSITTPSKVLSQLVMT